MTEEKNQRTMTAREALKTITDQQRGGPNTLAKWIELPDQTVRNWCSKDLPIMAGILIKLLFIAHETGSLHMIIDKFSEIKIVNKDDIAITMEGRQVN